MNFSKVSSDRKQQNFVESLETKNQRGPTALTGVELYSVVTLLVTLSAFGMAGNVLVLWVFRQKKDKLVSTVLIIVLACVDLSTCVVVIPYTVFMESVGFLIENDVVCKVYQFLITSNIPFSALIMVTIAVDRYLCICHPFLRSGSTRKAKRAVVGLGLFAAGIGLCVSLMYGVYYRPAGSQLQPPDASVPSRTATVEPQNYVIEAALLNAPPNRLNETQSLEGKLRSPGIVCLKPIPTTNYSEQPPEDPDQRAAYDGVCAPNDLLLSRDFQWYFQKVYNGLFLVCFVTVVALYVLIYRSVLLRRRRRLREKRKSQSIVASLAKQKNRDSVVMQEMITIACEQKDGMNVPIVRDLLRDQSHVGNGNRTGRRKSWSLDSNWMVNMKTAAMLFVVTVVFIVTFLPAFMMTLGFVPYNAFVFYLYFANNVANPLIYSFMNQNFRDDLRKIFCRRYPGTTAF